MFDLKKSDLPAGALLAYATLSPLMVIYLWPRSVGGSLVVLALGLSSYAIGLRLFLRVDAS